MPPSTRLGNWYANRLNIGRHRLILCTNERSLLSLVVPAKDLPGLPQRIIESLGPLLVWLGVPERQVGHELREMRWVRFAPTASRSVLGSMNDMALHADAYFRRPSGLVYLDALDRYLAENICGALSYAKPREAALSLFGGAA